MKISDTVDLKQVLAAHSEWAKDYYGIKGASLSDERRANLSGANLSVANLSGAYLSGAYLIGANLSGADLSGADLSGADLIGADLSGAYLIDADLIGADLSGAYLIGAYLIGAYLSGAYLIGADLSRADLSGANLIRADLSGANLSGANLSGADLRGAKNLPEFQIVPEFGAITGWKKLTNGVLAMVEIPAEAERVSSTGRKCRAEHVITRALEKDGKPFDGIGIGEHDGKTEYKVGEITRCDTWDPDFRTECSGGIHFFLRKSEAAAY